MERKPISLSASVVAVMLGMLAPTLEAANLLTNPDFDTNLTGWTNGDGIGNGIGTFTLNNADGSPGAPSAELASRLNEGAVAISNCIVIDTTQNVDLYANIKVIFGSGGVNAFAYSDATCTTGLGNATAPIEPLTTGTWQPVSSVNFRLPAGTQSVVIQLNTSGGNVVQPSLGDVLFDHIRFGPTGTVAVRLQSFKVD